MNVRSFWMITVISLSLLVLGCQQNASKKKTLRVFAASSLHEAFQDLRKAYESVYRNTLVSLNFSGSQTLRLQLEQGARADIYASANSQHMGALLRQKLVLRPRTFAYNELVVVVNHNNPFGLKVFGDLLRVKRLVVGSIHVPIGRYTKSLFLSLPSQVRKDLEKRIVSRENNVRLVRAKVEIGEADAAIVYRTDAISSKQVKSIEIPLAGKLRASYQMGVLARSRLRGQAQQWLALVASRRGQSILSARGFIVKP